MLPHVAHWFHLAFDRWFRLWWFARNCTVETLLCASPKMAAQDELLVDLVAELWMSLFNFVVWPYWRKTFRDVCGRRLCGLVSGALVFFAHIKQAQDNVLDCHSFFSPAFTPCRLTLHSVCTVLYATHTQYLSNERLDEVAQKAALAVNQGDSECGMCSPVRLPSNIHCVHIAF